MQGLIGGYDVCCCCCCCLHCRRSCMPAELHPLNPNQDCSNGVKNVLQCSAEAEKTIKMMKLMKSGDVNSESTKQVGGAKPLLS